MLPIYLCDGSQTSVLCITATSRLSWPPTDLAYKLIRNADTIKFDTNLIPTAYEKRRNRPSLCYSIQKIFVFWFWYWNFLSWDYKSKLNSGKKEYKMHVKLLDFRAGRLSDQWGDRFQTIFFDIFRHLCNSKYTTV